MPLEYGRDVNLFSHGVSIYEYFWAHLDKILKLGDCVTYISLCEVIKYMSNIHLFNCNETDSFEFI